MYNLDRWVLALIALGLALLCAFRAHAEAVVGGSFLAATHKEFPCNRVLSFYKKADYIYMSTLWDSFGTNRKCLKKVSLLQAPKFIEIIFSNEVCRKKGNCAPYEWMAKWDVKRYNRRLKALRSQFKKRIIKRTQAIHNFCMEHFKAPCALSAGLESQLTKTALKNLINTFIEAGQPYEFTIHNPSSQGPYSGRGGAYYLERHSSELHCEPVSQCIFSADGLHLSGCKGESNIGNKLSAGDSRAWVDTRRERAAYIGLWCPLHQGLKLDSAGALDPRRRDIVTHLSDMGYFHSLTK